MRAEIWDERVGRAKEFFEAGLSNLAVAKNLGVCPTTVAVYRKRLNGGTHIDAKRAAISECASAGLTRQETADKLGLSIYTVGGYGRRHAIEFRHATWASETDPRSEAMAAMYSGGKTLQEVGDLYGVTRERVRQIIKARHGLVGKDGGQAAVAERARQRRAAERDAKCLAEHGCTHAQLTGLRELSRQMVADGVGAYRTPVKAFTGQRQNAKARGIEWKLSLWDWWTFWQQSGKWEQRGRGHGYMMCRFADAGAYEVGNIYIATGVHNSSVQPNNRSRKTHPLHAEFIQARAA